MSEKNKVEEKRKKEEFSIGYNYDNIKCCLEDFKSEEERLRREGEEKLSELSRRIVYTIIATLWIINYNNSHLVLVNKSFAICILSCVLYLMLDLIQYYTYATRHGIYNKINPLIKSTENLQNNIIKNEKVLSNPDKQRYLEIELSNMYDTIVNSITKYMIEYYTFTKKFYFSIKTMVLIVIVFYFSWGLWGMVENKNEIFKEEKNVITSVQNSLRTKQETKTNKDMTKMIERKRTDAQFVQGKEK